MSGQVIERHLRRVTRELSVQRDTQEIGESRSNRIRVGMLPLRHNRNDLRATDNFVNRVIGVVESQRSGELRDLRPNGLLLERLTTHVVPLTVDAMRHREAERPRIAKRTTVNEHLKL